MRLPLLPIPLVPLALLALAGCVDAPPSSQSGPPATLQGAVWHADTVNGTVLDLPRPTLVFHAGGRLAGQGPCNSFAGTYEEGIALLSVGPLAVTRKACTPPVMQREDAFFAVLRTTNSYALAPAGTLTLRGPDGVIVAVR